MAVQIGSLNASLDQWRIRLQLNNLTLLSQRESEAKFSLRAGRVDLTLDLLKSVQLRSPVFKEAALEQADVLLQQYDGRWFAETSSTDSQTNPLLGVLALLQHQPSIRLTDVSLGLQPEEGSIQLISPINALFEAAAGEYQFSGSIRIPQIGEDAYVVLAVHALELDPMDLLAGHYRFFLQSDALGPELLKLGLEPLSEFTSLNLSTHIWGEWKGRQLAELQGDLFISPLELASDHLPTLDQLSLQFAFLPLSQQRYQLQLRQITALSNEDRLVIPELIAEFQLNEEKQPLVELVQLASLDLAATHHWISQINLLPEEVDEILARLSPSGQLVNFVMTWPEPSDLLSFTLLSQLQEVAVSAWEDAPAASGINGVIHANAMEGKVVLESAAFSLDFPQLFGSSWRYSEASGEVTWQVKGDALRLNSGVLSLSNNDIQAKGRFGLYRPFDPEEQIEFSLLIGITETDAMQTEFYTPPKEMGQTLYDWLKTAVRAGRVNQAGLMIHAGLRPGSYQLPVTVQLFLDAEDAEFAFDPSWPRVEQGKVFLHLRNTELRIDIASAKILNSTIRNGWVYLPPKSQTLNIAALMEGEASDFSRLLSESALGGFLGSAFDDWVLAGPTITRLGLQLPVDDPDRVAVQVSTQLLGNRLHLQGRDLQFSDITGQIGYTTQQGLTSDQLQGRLFNQPLTASIDTQGEQTRVVVQGAVASTHLDHLTGLPLAQRAQGLSQAQVTLTLCPQTLQCPRIEVRSDLLGTAIDLPLNLGKDEMQRRHLYVDLFPERQRLHISYDRMLQAAFDLSVPLRGQLRLGEGKALLPTGNYLEVMGETPELRLQGRVEPLANEWSAHFSHFHWRGSPQETETDVEEEPAAPVRMDFSRFPQVRLHIDDLNYRDKPLGEWSLALRPSGHQLSFESIQGRLRSFNLTGHAHWSAADFPSTQLTANLNGVDLAEIFQLWDLGRPIETRQLTSAVQLSWKGAPWDFRLASLDGAFQFQADNGRIIESGAGANVLRIFGLLNLNTLSRRLRLDFSDLLQKGLVFDQIKANYDLNQGVARLENPLEMTGPSANMEITGQVDLNSHQLDKTIRVSVPLGSNLTLGAALLGAPHVAGALFIFDRIMGDRIDKMTRIAYTLTGDWRDPQLNLLNPADR